MHMIVPAYVVFIVRILLQILVNHKQYVPGNLLLTCFYASGSAYKSIDAFGMMWFLIVLFEVRTLYDLLHFYLKGWKMTGICILLSCTGVLIGKSIYLPFSIDLMMTVLFLFHTGQLLKQVDFHAIKRHCYIVSFTL